MEIKTIIQNWTDSVKLIFIANVNNNIAGTICATIENNDIWVYGFYVSDEYRQRGIGTNLMKALLSYIEEHEPNKNVRLQVVPQKEWLVKFYQQFGFKQDLDEYVTMKLKKEIEEL